MSDKQLSVLLRSYMNRLLAIETELETKLSESKEFGVEETSVFTGKKYRHAPILNDLSEFTSELETSITALGL